MVAVDDLYLPYRPRERHGPAWPGNGDWSPWQTWIASQNAGTSLEDAAKPYVSEEKGVDSVKTAIAGAKDILAERIAEDAGYRTWVREITMNEGRIASRGPRRGGSGVRIAKYSHYEEPAEELPRPPCPGLEPGGREDTDGEGGSAGGKDPPVSEEAHVITGKDPVTSLVLKEVVKDSYGRLMAPAIEREIRNAVTEKAENGAFQVFKKTLNQLLDGASHQRPGGPGLGSGFPYRLQAGGGGSPPERCWIPR